VTALTRSDRIDDIKGHPQGEIRGRTKLVKITEDVRKYAAQRGLTDAEAIEEGLKQKATEFNDAGAEIYAKA
jgi:hypothetical protein